jgi:carboxymethylenebutenolidase
MKDTLARVALIGKWMMMAKTLVAAAAAALLACNAWADEMVTLLPGSPDEIAAFAAGPENAQARVLIVHDWFGLTPSTKDEAEWFGEHGIRAVAIDLYGGEAADTHDEAEKLMNGLDPAAAAETIRNALEAIGAMERPVAIVGYSMGGKIALEAQLANPEMIAGAALIYGAGYGELSESALRSLERPVLVATGSADTGSVTAMDALQHRMSDFGHPIEAYVYPGVDHAYAQALFNGGANYDREATMATRNVVEHFVKRVAASTS